MNTKARVPTTETGALAGDGKGSQGMKIPTGPARQPDIGRHFQNSRMANVGTIRGGQAEPASNKVKTGVPPGAPIRSMAPRPSIPANQAETSRDLERRIVAAPQPFTYEGGAATTPTGRLDMSTLGIPYNVMAPVDAKPQSYGAYVGCGNTQMTADEARSTGHDRAQVIGWRGYREQQSVRGVGSNPRQAKMPGTKNSGTSSRDNSRMRQG